jgi:hypothetical protein
MRSEAFTDVFSEEFRSFTSRMWLDYCDENSAFGSVCKDYPTYLVDNFKYLVRRFNKNNGNEQYNIK